LLEEPERAAQVQGAVPEQEPERTLQAPALERVLVQPGPEAQEPERVQTWGQ
jgi:hypothetical protein